MIKDALPGEELLITYGQAYFEEQRALIAHCVRESLKAWTLRKSLTDTFRTTSMTLLQTLEELVMVSRILLCSRRLLHGFAAPGSRPFMQSQCFHARRVHGPHAWPMHGHSGTSALANMPLYSEALSALSHAIISDTALSALTRGEGADFV